MKARIAVNALALRPGGSGVQTYIRELLRALVGQVDAELVAAVQADSVGELPIGISPRTYPVADGIRRALAGLRAPGRADLIHGLDAALPIGGRVPRVTTFHDLAVFDVPWAFSRRRASAKRIQLRHAARAADLVIAVSSFTAERVRAILRRDAVVIPEAPGPEFAPPSKAAIDAVRTRYRLPERFVFHAGTIEPRKDVPRLAEACARAGVSLVLAGMPSPLVDSASLQAQLLGHIPQSDLVAMFGAATVVAYPSLYEGFGLPPLEAMACGAPVVATSCSSLPETLGDAAAVIAPGDVAALAATLADLLHDAPRRAALSSAGLARARSFSWETTARLTADCYRSLGLIV